MSDRCKPHGARACRRCETPGEQLSDATLATWRHDAAESSAMAAASFSTCCVEVGKCKCPPRGWKDQRILALITEVERLREAAWGKDNNYALVSAEFAGLEARFLALRAAVETLALYCVDRENHYAQEWKAAHSRGAHNTAYYLGAEDTWELAGDMVRGLLVEAGDGDD